MLPMSDRITTVCALATLAQMLEVPEGFSPDTAKLGYAMLVRSVNSPTAVTSSAADIDRDTGEEIESRNLR